MPRRLQPGQRRGGASGDRRSDPPRHDARPAARLDAPSFLHRRPAGVPIDVEPPLEAINDQLEQIRPPLPANRVRRHVVVGPAVDKIVEVSEELGAAVIVMGTHARHGLARWILGSVVEPVLRAAPCPVLICRGPHRDSHGDSTEANRG